jgi:hypothetical protein
LNECLRAAGLPGRGQGSGQIMEPRDVVVVGGSAGSMEPLRQLGDDPVSQRDNTIKWATDLADTVRAEMRKVPDAAEPQ